MKKKEKKQFYIDQKFSVWWRYYIEAETAEEAARIYDSGEYDEAQSELLDDTYEELNEDAILFDNESNEDIPVSQLLKQSAL